MTNRERARLQTFPDDFVFEGNRGSVRRQIGMAVPLKMSRLLFESMIKTLFKIPYPYVGSEEALVEDFADSTQKIQTLFFTRYKRAGKRQRGC